MLRRQLQRTPTSTGVGRVLSLLLAAASSWACSASSDAGHFPPDPSAQPTGSVPGGPGSSSPPQLEPPDLSGLQCAPQNPVPSEGRLLTRVQYDNSVRDLFQGRIQGAFSASFPPENQVLGFSNNAQSHRASSWLAEDQMKAAESIASMAVADLATLVPCSVTNPDAACAASFIQDFGARAFRRPLLPEESAPFERLFETASVTQGFARGIENVVRAVLQSPQFLYRLEFDVSAPLSAEVAVVPGFAVSGYEVRGYEMASRLSYFLWNSMPDAELLRAASVGELATAEQVAAQARRMLSDDKARSTVLDFHRQWLGVERMDAVVRGLEDGSTAGYAADWRKSLELFLENAFWNGQPPGLAATAPSPVSGLFTSKTVYLNPSLAALYGVSLPVEAGPTDFYPVELEPTARAGLLTQPALMALLAHPDQSAPIQRGVFVREEVLCQPAPPAPPSVDPTPPDPDPSLTTRERFAVHTEDPVCAGCHSLIDPLGLGFENFDHLGRYRANENGRPIDVSGAVVATREAEIVGAFDGAVQLSERLAGSTQVRDCVATQWYRYASGRIEDEADLCSLAQITQAFEHSGGDMIELLVAVTQSDAFRYRSEAPLQTGVTAP